MLDELAGAAAYRGARGAPAVDEAELTAAIVAFGNLIAAREDIAEIEVNPLRVTRNGPGRSRCTGRAPMSERGRSSSAPARSG